MRQRWTPVVALAGGLFALNAISRLLIWKAHVVKESDQTRISLVLLGLVGLILLGAAAWWAVRFPPVQAIGDLLLAGSVGCLLSVLVGPFFSAGKAYEGGLGPVIGQILAYLGVAGVGALIGFLGVTAFGLDWTTRAWKRGEANLRANRRR